MFRTMTSLLLVLLGATALAAEGDGESHVIKLHRPDHKGAKFEVSIAGAVRQQTRMRQGEESSEPSDHLFGVELKGFVEIEDVDDRGNATRATYTIERCVKVVDNRDEVIVPKGTVIIAEAGERDTTFTLKDGGELTDAQRSALDVVASLPRKNAPTADELFGTGERQKVGASWPVNVDALVKDAETFGMKFDREKTSGTVKLVEVTEQDGIEFLRFTADTKVGAYTMEIPKEWKLPPGMEFKGGTIEMSLDGRLPADPAGTHAIVSNAYTRTMVFEGEVRPGTTTRMEMQTSQMVQLHAVPVKD